MSSHENADSRRAVLPGVSENARRGNFPDGEGPRLSAVEKYAVRLSVMATMPPDKEMLWASDWRCSRLR
ncbi:hypothetical protein AERO9AM_10274 [Aeromicrobium sp. 9AM]|nr:hypothetical protein AERO9AM_10274 [Aeromicrobium sp. 9AM]